MDLTDAFGRIGEEMFRTRVVQEIRRSMCEFVKRWDARRMQAAEML
jgi:hypothetical protein